MRLIQSITLAALLLCAGAAAALQPSDAGWWHAPGKDGSGILLEYNANNDTFAVLWFDHGFNDEQQWFISDGVCPVGAPCDVAMLTTSAPWLGGEVTFTDVGTLSLTRVPDGLLMEWTLLGLVLRDGRQCGELTVGGVIFWQCDGERVLEPLTQPIP